MELKIVFEDDKIIICNKPTGVLAQSGKSFDVDMVSALMSYRKKKGEDIFVGVINRLDRPVSGLMLFAKTKEEAARLNKIMQENLLNKHYYAIVCGKPSTNKGTLVDYLIRDGKNNTSTVVTKDAKDAKRAELEFEIINSIIDEVSGNELTLLRVRLITGRHHQIRVQFASRGFALLGDTKYGIVDQHNSSYIDQETKGIALCAYRLQLEKQTFEIEPEDRIYKLFK